MIISVMTAVLQNSAIKGQKNRALVHGLLYNKNPQKLLSLMKAYNEPSTNNIPYKIPNEYGKNKLNTLGERTAENIKNRVITNAYAFGKNSFDILNTKFIIPTEAHNPTKYKTFNFIGKIKNKNAFIM